MDSCSYIYPLEKELYAPFASSTIILGVKLYPTLCCSGPWPSRVTCATLQKTDMLKEDYDQQFGTEIR